MDAGLVWTAVSTLGTCAGLGIAWWQLRLQAMDRRRVGEDASKPEVFGFSVAVPTGALPAQVHGRDELIRELRRWARRPPGLAIVLAGLGGMGKSTVAAALADQWRAGRRRRCVWWVSAADRSTLAAGVITVARHLGGAPPDLVAIVSGAADGPDRFWALLNRAPAGWILIFDNADDPDVLAAVPRRRATGDEAAPPPAARGPGDGTGWVRPSRRGLVLVTSRDADLQTWGRHALVRVVKPLGEADAVCVLCDLAGEPGDQADARMLARRLGGLPLALHLVGAYLGSGAARWPTFAAYRQALDDGDGAQLLDGPDPRHDPRSVVTQTWEISLDDLAHSGIPQARGLLRLLSCYAPATPIPLDLLDGRRLAHLLRSSPEFDPMSADRLVEQAVRGLNRLGLVETRLLRQATAVVVHPVVADSNRHYLAAGPARQADPPHAKQIAVDLVIAYLAELRPDRPADWLRYQTLGPHLRALLDHTPSLDRAHLTTLIESTLDTARAVHLSGALEDSENLCHAARHHARELGQDHPVTLRVGVELAWVAADRGRWMEAEHRYRQALDQSRRLLGNDHPETLTVGHQWAWAVAILGQLATAETIYRDTLQARQRVLGESHPDTLASYHELAWVTASQGCWAEAEDAYRQVLPKLRQVLGNDHPDTLTTCHELAWAIANQDRLDEAHAAFEQVLQDRRRVLGDEHPRTLTTLHELAWVAGRQGHLAEAEERYRQVWRQRRQVLGDDHPDTLLARHELAWVTAKRGRLITAETIYSEVLPARRRVLGEDHPDTLATQAALNGLQQHRIVDARHLA
jgi:tetratricopeptide (TPR) repeat protein